MITIHCEELTFDEQVALAAAISDDLAGRALALVQGSRIVLDSISKDKPSPIDVEPIVKHFLSKRKDAEHYSVERDGENFEIHSPDPLARGRGRKSGQLPENLLKCPQCGFVTQYQELYVVHSRTHGLLPY